MYSEKTLRKRAYRIGYQVEKGYSRNLWELYRDKSGRAVKGYHIKSLYTGDVVIGMYQKEYDHSASLEDVEAFLEEQYESRGLKW